MNISVNWSYFDLDWGKLDIVHLGFGFVDNYLSKMWRFNQLGKFFYWIWSIFEQNMDKFSQVRTFSTYIMVQESGSTSRFISITNRSLQWLSGFVEINFTRFLLSAGFLQVSFLNLLLSAGFLQVSCCEHSTLFVL